MNRNEIQFSFETEYEKGDQTLFVSASGYQTVYRPATMYKNNGDPGDPAEGGEIEFEKLEVTDENDNIVDSDLIPQDWLDDMAINNLENGRDF